MFWKINNNANEFQDTVSVIRTVGPLEKQPDEDDVEYYTRIFQKKPKESEEDVEERVTVIKKQLPRLPIWKNDLYKNYITTVDTGPENGVTVTTTTTTTKKSLPSTNPTSVTEVSKHDRSSFCVI